MALVNYINFKKKFVSPEQNFSSIIEKYKKIRHENGNADFVLVGTTDLYELAQSHKEACLIENIIRRATNDPSVLRRTVGSYVDITEVPTNMFDAMKVIDNAKKTFENLPNSVKDSYNNSFESFLGGFKTASGLAKFLDLTKKTENLQNMQENVNESEVDN